MRKYDILNKVYCNAYLESGCVFLSSCLYLETLNMFAFVFLSRTGSVDSKTERPLKLSVNQPGIKLFKIVR